jgi:hypothetical protein
VINDRSSNGVIDRRASEGLFQVSGDEGVMKLQNTLGGILHIRFVCLFIK